MCKMWASVYLLVACCWLGRPRWLSSRREGALCTVNGRRVGGFPHLSVLRKLHRVGRCIYTGVEFTLKLRNGVSGLCPCLCKLHFLCSLSVSYNGLLMMRGIKIEMPSNAPSPHRVQAVEELGRFLVASQA